MNKQVKVNLRVDLGRHTYNFREISTCLVIGRGLCVEHEDNTLASFKSLHIRGIIDREGHVRWEVIHNELDMWVVGHLHRVCRFPMFQEERFMRRQFLKHDLLNTGLAGTRVNYISHF